MLTKEQEQYVIQEAMRVFGSQLQFDMLSEECGELLSAMNKYRRGRISALDLIEEIVDVQIICEQILHLVDTDKKATHKMRQAKLERLRTRLLNSGKANMQLLFPMD